MSNLDIEKIDVEMFITEVAKKPSVWDIRCEEYKDRNKKIAAWNSISCALFANFSDYSEDDKKFVEKKLQHKWRNIRDYYRKYTKKEKSGPGSVKKFKYIYADQLGFLSPVLEIISAPTSNAQAEETENFEEFVVKEGNNQDDSQSIRETDPLVPEQSAIFDEENKSEKNKKKAKKTDLESKLITFLENAPMPSAPKPNDDRSFFESLLPTLDTFDIDQKLEFRMKVLHVLQRIRKRSNSQMVQDCPTSYFQSASQQCKIEQTEFEESEHKVTSIEPSLTDTELSPFSDDTETY